MFISLFTNCSFQYLDDLVHINAPETVLLNLPTRFRAVFERLVRALRTSGLMLIPVTHPTGNVLLNVQNYGASADKRTRPGVHPRSTAVHRPIQIWPSELHRSNITYARNARVVSDILRTCNRVSCPYRDWPLTH